MKIAVCTMAIGEDYQKIVHPILDMNHKYCIKFGYDFMPTYGIPEKLDRHLSWYRLKILERVSREYSHVFWIDADAVFFNHNIPLKKYCDVHSPYVFSIDSCATINAGAWIAFNDDKFKEQLRRWWASPIRDDRWWEQAAMIADLPKKYRVDYELSGIYNDLPIENTIKNLSMRIQGLTPADLQFAREKARLYMFDPDYHHICHFAGRGIENKGLKQCIEKILPKIKR